MSIGASAGLLDAAASTAKSFASPFHAYIEGSCTLCSDCHLDNVLLRNPPCGLHDYAGLLESYFGHARKILILPEMDGLLEE